MVSHPVLAKSYVGTRTLLLGKGLLSPEMNGGLTPLSQPCVIQRLVLLRGPRVLCTSPLPPPWSRPPPPPALQGQLPPARSF